jgi:hypothetical protein
MSDDLSSLGVPYSDQDRENFSATLYEVLCELCKVHDLVAYVSLKTCEEIVDRFRHDVARLLEGKNQRNIHPAKYVGYLCFWVRKLKPISRAFSRTETQKAKDRGGALAHQDEIITANETVTVSLCVLWLFKFCKAGKIPELNGMTVDRAKERLSNAMFDVLNLGSDVGAREGSILESVTYDMRYRTFGPHHLVHLNYHILSVARLSSDVGAR